MFNNNNNNKAHLQQKQDGNGINGGDSCKPKRPNNGLPPANLKPNYKKNTNKTQV